MGIVKNVCKSAKLHIPTNELQTLPPNRPKHLFSLNNLNQTFLTLINSGIKLRQLYVYFRKKSCYNCGRVTQ